MITVQSRDLKRLAAGAKEFPKVLRASTRKQLSVIARVGAADARSAIRGMPVKGDVPYRQGSGLRTAIGSAIRVSATVNNTRGVAVSIRVAQTGALQVGNRWRAARLLDSGPFRHPVYGNRDTFVTQAGYPYFDERIGRRLPEMHAAAAAALREATFVTLPNVR